MAEKPLEPQLMEPEQSSAIDVITAAEIDIQIATAKKYPRDLMRVKDKMVSLATLDEETAEQCFYSLPRDGKSIKGPSIRMAEIALYCFGNIRAGNRSVGESADGKFVRELGVCHDLENNVFVAREVSRRITTKSGARFSDDMIGTTRGAAGAIALRNATFTIVPRALVKPAFERAMALALGKTKSLTVRVTEVMEKLKKLSPLITNEKILALCEKRSIADLTWDDVGTMIGAGTAIKDGVQTVEGMFPNPQSSAGDVKITDLKGTKKAESPEPPSPPEPTESLLEPTGLDVEASAGSTPPPASSPSGVPWPTISAETCASFRKRLKALGFEESDLMGTVVDESVRLEDMPLDRQQNAEEIIANSEARRAKGKK